MSSKSEMESMDVDSNEKHETNHKIAPNLSPNSTKSTVNKTEKEMSPSKRAALRDKLRKKIGLNRSIVVSGCGNWRCTNPYCKSNVLNRFKEYTDSSASKLAVSMVKLKHKNCSLFTPLNVISLCASTIEELKDDSDVLFAFKHWDYVLSESFYNNVDDVITEKDICIDFACLNSTFSAILSNSELSDKLRSILSLSIAAKRKEVDNNISISSLRSIVILLLFPLVLSEDISCHSLLILICKLIEDISGASFSKILIIGSWFSNCLSYPVLCGVLSSLQQYMTLKMSFAEDCIEDLSDEWRHELKYDSVEDTDERDEIEQEIASKQQCEREKYILADITAVICVIDIIHSCNMIGDSLFNNDGLNDTICSRGGSRSTMHRRDLIHYRERDFFTFLSYPYLLSAASKSRYLEFENLISQHRARRRRMFDLMFVSGIGAMSGIGRNQLIEELDLVLRIRRNSIISDTLGILQISSSGDLRKRLRIIFDGEEGIDQGGLTKEYFQLIMNELFDPKYGMFIEIQNSEYYWFNRDCFDYNSNRSELLLNYELCGKLVGIAIYNNTILDLRFPKIIFKKLLENNNIEFDDFRDYDPIMAKAFEQLLSSTEQDIESIYCRNFVIEYKNIFGETKNYKLIKNGENINLNEKNRQNYVDLYIQYCLSDSIKQQFGAFLNGFKTVCDSQLFKKFTHKELELLICGSDCFDFDALENTTKYQDGLHRNSRLIRDFWDIAHQLTNKNKRKLLTFCTGSDRVPINGLGEVSLTISKNGDDNNKLPTSHTCFNHLLLPEYDNKDILKSRLLTAIHNSQGFGLL